MLFCSGPLCFNLIQPVVLVLLIHVNSSIKIEIILKHIFNRLSFSFGFIGIASNLVL